MTWPPSARLPGGRARDQARDGTWAAVQAASILGLQRLLHKAAGCMLLREQHQRAGGRRRQRCGSEQRQWMGASGSAEPLRAWCRPTLSRGIKPSAARSTARLVRLCRGGQDRNSRNGMAVGGPGPVLHSTGTAVMAFAMSGPRLQPRQLPALCAAGGCGQVRPLPRPRYQQPARCESVRGFWVRVCCWPGGKTDWRVCGCLCCAIARSLWMPRVVLRLCRRMPSRSRTAKRERVS